MLRTAIIILLAASATAFSTAGPPFVRPMTSAISMTANGDDGKESSLADKAKNTQRSFAAKNAELEEKLKDDDEDEGFASMEMMFHQVINTNGADGFGTMETVKEDAEDRESF